MTREELAKFKLPDEPGIYMFKHGRKILYIGKATSLRDRVRSYFSTDLAEARSVAVAQMVQEADRISYQKADSVLEALILEANLIRRHMPPYNSASKDNKSFNYLVITKERFPRIIVVRGRDLYQNWNEGDIRNLFGPFPHGLALQEAVKIIRKIFPHRDSKCTPCEDQKKKPCRPCFNRQIGMCPGVCTGEVSREEYMSTVRHICELFSGNFHGLKRTLNKEMKEAAKNEEFELAARLRRQCEALEHIKDVSLIKSESRISSGGPANSHRGVVRVEAYDVAHTSGQETVGVMTVVEDGHSSKGSYRKFKIRNSTNDDVASLKEVLTRRLNHPEWPLPRVFAVDGGKGQMNAAYKLLKDAGLMIPVVGVVKDEFHRPQRLIGDKLAIERYEREILLANNEAHRYAISWHRRRRRDAMGLGRGRGTGVPRVGRQQA